MSTKETKTTYNYNGHPAHIFGVVPTLTNLTLLGCAELVLLCTVSVGDPLLLISLGSALLAAFLAPVFITGKTFRHSSITVLLASQLTLIPFFFGSIKVEEGCFALLASFNSVISYAALIAFFTAITVYLSNTTNMNLYRWSVNSLANPWLVQSFGQPAIYSGCGLLFLCFDVVSVTNTVYTNPQVSDTGTAEATVVPLVAETQGNVVLEPVANKVSPTQATDSSNAMQKAVVASTTTAITSASIYLVMTQVIGASITYIALPFVLTAASGVAVYAYAASIPNNTDAATCGFMIGCLNIFNFHHTDQVAPISNSSAPQPPGPGVVVPPHQNHNDVVPQNGVDNGNNHQPGNPPDQARQAPPSDVNPDRSPSAGEAKAKQLHGEMLALLASDLQQSQQGLQPEQRFSEAEQAVMSNPMMASALGLSFVLGARDGSSGSTSQSSQVSSPHQFSPSVQSLPPQVQVAPVIQMEGDGRFHVQQSSQSSHSQPSSSYQLEAGSATPGGPVANITSEEQLVEQLLDGAVESCPLENVELIHVFLAYANSGNAKYFDERWYGVVINNPATLEELGSNFPLLMTHFARMVISSLSEAEDTVAFLTKHNVWYKPLYKFLTACALRHKMLTVTGTTQRKLFIINQYTKLLARLVGQPDATIVSTFATSKVIFGTEGKDGQVNVSSPGPATAVKAPEKKRD